MAKTRPQHTINLHGNNNAQTGPLGINFTGSTTSRVCTSMMISLLLYYYHYYYFAVSTATEIGHKSGIMSAGRPE
jgi:hypothetical protein